MNADKKFWQRLSTVGKLTILIGLVVASPVLVLPFFPDEISYAWTFLFPGLGSITLGLSHSFLTDRQNTYTTDRSDEFHKSSIIVVFAWCWGFLVGALPFVLANQLRFVQALFESVSGFTTTGLSVMDVSKVPQVFLFYRSFMQYCGGLGFVMVMLVIVSGKRSMDLFSAEGHPDKLLPALKRTAQVILAMYVGFLIIGTIAYTLCGMPVFDSINHTMCALSTGGFSTKLNSIGEYQSVAIDLVTIFLMVIGTTNFAVLLLFVKGQWRKFAKVSEMRFFALLMLISGIVCAIDLSRNFNWSFWEGLRQSVFNTSSALSTTGYSTMSYADWPQFSIGVMIVLMLVGGGIGSTAGGLKLSRVYLMFRMIWIHIKKSWWSDRRVTVDYYTKAQGKTKIDTTLCMETLNFIACYIILFLVGTLALTLTADITWTQAMFEFASSIGTVGLSIGITGPATNDPTLIVEIIGMFIGRLEIFIVIVGCCSTWHMFSRFFRRKRS